MKEIQLSQYLCCLNNSFILEREQRKCSKSLLSDVQVWHGSVKLAVTVIMFSKLSLSMYFRSLTISGWASQRSARGDGGATLNRWQRAEGKEPGIPTTQKKPCRNSESCSTTSSK